VNVAVEEKGDKEERDEPGGILYPTPVSLSTQMNAIDKKRSDQRDA